MVTLAALVSWIHWKDVQRRACPTCRKIIVSAARIGASRQLPDAPPPLKMRLQESQDTMLNVEL